MAPTLEQPPTSRRAIDPMVPARHRILRFRQETGDTFTLEIERIDGAGHFGFKPGQFNMVYVFGVGEVPVSISGDPAEQKLLEHTTRVVGAVTGAMRRLRTGDEIGVRGPFGSHWPIAEAAGGEVVLVAGGIGLAPLRPALYQLLANREKYRRIVLVYGTRTPEDVLYRSELERWRSKLDLEVYVTVDRASGAWRGNVGVVSSLLARAPLDPSNATALVCGPEVMMRFAVTELLKRGIDPNRIHLSLERNMKCAIGFCGHCQLGRNFICKDGPVFPFDRLEAILGKGEI